MSLQQQCQPIRLILSDVDGVLTDGGITFDSQGVELKRFSVRDGLGIKLWQNVGYQFGIITARESTIVQKRCDELGIEHLYQGCKDKLSKAKQIIDSLNLKKEQVAYIGDDLPDLAVIKYVGFGVTVADGCAEVREAADWQTTTNGGSGTVRELVETILCNQEIWFQAISKFQ